jgi:hypothetical protein
MALDLNTVLGPSMPCMCTCPEKKPHMSTCSEQEFILRSAGMDCNYKQQSQRQGAQQGKPFCVPASSTVTVLAPRRILICGVLLWWPWDHSEEALLRTCSGKKFSLRSARMNCDDHETSEETLLRTCSEKKFNLRSAFVMTMRPQRGSPVAYLLREEV